MILLEQGLSRMILGTHIVCPLLQSFYTTSQFRSIISVPQSSGNKLKCVTSSLNTDASFGTGDRLRESILGNGSQVRGTRLSRVLLVQQKQLLSKFNQVRRKLPMKIFLLLLGFYSANALSTILGQTGDWDVLVAGIAIAVIEMVGSLMYRKPPMPDTIQFFVSMVNYWKGGFILGLFVDAFKVGS